RSEAILPDVDDGLGATQSMSLSGIAVNDGSRTGRKATSAPGASMDSRADCSNWEGRLSQFIMPPENITSLIAAA
ncbi:hypothetical protein C6A36_03205, partial [Desulfobacteraceae bacterium SEEP-SAG10]